MLFCCLLPCSHSEHIGREQLLKERSDAQKLVNRLYIVVVKHSHVESTWLDKQRTSALALCESLMHSKRPGRIDRCRLESTRNHTGAFLDRKPLVRPGVQESFSDESLKEIEKPL